MIKLVVNFCLDILAGLQLRIFYCYKHYTTKGYSTLIRLRILFRGIGYFAVKV